MKVLLDHNPLTPSNLPPTDFDAAYRTRPAWITPGHLPTRPEVTAYRLRFEVLEAVVIQAHVSADERYVLFVDGQRMGRGPERGSDSIWFYETYELDLTVGSHTIVAVVWRLGEIGPLAQVGLAGGFLLVAPSPFAEMISTKSGSWETKPVGGLSFSLPSLPSKATAWFAGPIQTTIATDFPWGMEKGEGEDWKPVITRHEDFTFPFGIKAVHILQPAMLPAQMALVRNGGRVRYVSDRTWNDPQSVLAVTSACLPNEVDVWQSLIDESAPVVIPSNTRRQVILDLEQYVCAYPQIHLSGGNGSHLTVGWAEALYLDAAGQEKAQRDGVKDRTFIAWSRDVILPDGGTQRVFEPLWWRAGRFVELLIETGEQPLTIENFKLLETRYPLEMESRFSSSDRRLNAVIPLALRGLQMCAHETFMDCPYYEQMMYVGDSRLEALTTYAISTDDRLPRKSITLFGMSRLPDGLIQARYPAHDVQVIPPFALWWIGMVYDYALWRGDRAFVAEMLPGVRAVLEGFLTQVNSENLMAASAGWNFSDWVIDWPLGVPPDGFDGFSGLLNWHLVYTLRLVAHLEEWAGESSNAQRWYSWRDKIALATKAAFWDAKRGLFADDLAHTRFSEHTQCLSLLSGILEGEQYARTAQNLLLDTSLTRTTIYFNHYLFETYRILNQAEAFFARMELWFNLPAQGFKTTPEQPEPSRSDCHGWGAHPLYHYFASLLGIRPSSFGFDHVEIAPMPGHLTNLSGEMVHPRGRIETYLHFENGHVRGNISLPTGVTGVFRYLGRTLDLKPGAQAIDTSLSKI